MITLTGILLIIIGIFVLRIDSDVSAFGIVILGAGLFFLGYGLLPLFSQLN